MRALWLQKLPTPSPTPVSEAKIADLRKCTFAGCPFGDKAFVEQMEIRFQRRWLRKSQKSASAA